jgi:hypothetical protein
MRTSIPAKSVLISQQVTIPSQTTSLVHERSPKDISLENRERPVQFWLNKGGKKCKISQWWKRNFTLWNWNTSYVYRWKVQTKKSKSPWSKAKVTLYKHLHVWFIETKQKRCSINDSDLHDWALQITDEIGIGNFQTSASWILCFRWAHRTGSRKITKFV